MRVQRFESTTGIIKSPTTWYGTGSDRAKCRKERKKSIYAHTNNCHILHHHCGCGGDSNNWALHIPTLLTTSQLHVLILFNMLYYPRGHTTTTTTTTLYLVGWLCWQVRNLCLSKRRRTYVCNDLLKIHHLCKKICGEKLLYLWIMLFYLYNACQWVVAAANILLYCCGIVLHNMPLLFFAPRLSDNKSNSGERNMGGDVRRDKSISARRYSHTLLPRDEIP